MDRGSRARAQYGRPVFGARYGTRRAGRSVPQQLGAAAHTATGQLGAHRGTALGVGDTEGPGARYGRALIVGKGRSLRPALAMGTRKRPRHPAPWRALRDQGALTMAPLRPKGPANPVLSRVATILPSNEDNDISTRFAARTGISELKHPQTPEGVRPPGLNTADINLDTGGMPWGGHLSRIEHRCRSEGGHKPRCSTPMSPYLGNSDTRVELAARLAARCPFHSNKPPTDVIDPRSACKPRGSVQPGQYAVRPTCATATRPARSPGLSE